MNAMMKLKNHANNIKNNVKGFLKEEKGGAEIVATIVLVAIVVLLAVAFKEQLGTLVQDVWAGVNANADKLSETFSF